MVNVLTLHIGGITLEKLHHTVFLQAILRQLCIIMISAPDGQILLTFGQTLLQLFGASSDTLPYAMSYLNIYVIGTLFVMISLGLNSFISAQGFATHTRP